MKETKTTCDRCGTELGPVYFLLATINTEPPTVMSMKIQRGDRNPDRHFCNPLCLAEWALKAAKSK